MKTTMMDCIRRVPSLMEQALAAKEATFAGLSAHYGDRLSSLTEIVLVGSGTSYTASVTARTLTEQASGLRVTATTPGELMASISVQPINALYVFVSQTGTSTLTRQALLAARKKGLMAAAVSESADTPIAALADVWVDMRCGAEEYLMRTIGYSMTVLTLIMLGLEIGLLCGRLSSADYDRWLAEASAAAKAIPAVIRQAQIWLDRNRRKMLRSDCIIFTGAGALYGVALEAAVKTWEAPKIPAMGYELEEGMHGPNFGYDHRHCVIVLNDGGMEEKKALALCRYMKGEMNNGFLIGVHAPSEEDMGFVPGGGRFCCLEFAAAVQVLAYQLATAQGWDLTIRGDHARMYSYFNSHDNASEKR